MKNKKGKKIKSVIESKVIGGIILLSQILYILPAQTIVEEKNYGRMRLEQYLSWADRQKEEEDWERLGEEGILAAMSEWESANTYLKERNYEEYQANREKAYKGYERIKSTEYTYWYAKKRIEEENKIKRSELAQKLTEKSLEYKKRYKENGAKEEERKESEREWEKYGNELVREYINS